MSYSYKRINIAHIPGTDIIFIARLLSIMTVLNMQFHARIHAGADPGVGNTGHIPTPPSPVVTSLH